MTVHTTEESHGETLNHDADFMEGASHHIIHGHVKPYHNPDMHYSTYHPTYASLDHHYDDEHDVTPVTFHDHRVLKSPPFPDAQDFAHTDQKKLHAYRMTEASAEPHYYDKHYVEDEHPDKDIVVHKHHPRVYDEETHVVADAHKYTLHGAPIAHEVTHVDDHDVSALHTHTVKKVVTPYEHIIHHTPLHETVTGYPVHDVTYTTTPVVETAVGLPVHETTHFTGVVSPFPFVPRTSHHTAVVSETEHYTPAFHDTFVSHLPAHEVTHVTQVHAPYLKMAEPYHTADTHYVTDPLHGYDHYATEHVTPVHTTPVDPHSVDIPEPGTSPLEGHIAFATHLKRDWHPHYMHDTAGKVHAVGLSFPDLPPESTPYEAEHGAVRVDKESDHWGGFSHATEPDYGVAHRTIVHEGVPEAHISVHQIDSHPYGPHPYAPHPYAHPYGPHPYGAHAYAPHPAATHVPHHAIVEETHLLDPTTYRADEPVHHVPEAVSHLSTPWAASLHMAAATPTAPAHPVERGPDTHYSTYHYTHPQLDHHYDDAHDVTPVAYHDGRVLHALPHADAKDYLHTVELEHEGVLDASGSLLRHQSDYHFPTYEEALHHQRLTHPTVHSHFELDPVTVDGTHAGVSHHVFNPIPGADLPHAWEAEAHAVPLVHHGAHDFPVHLPAHGGKRYSEEEHHFVFPHDALSFEGHPAAHPADLHYATYHFTHPELDHHYDDAHDVTPVAFHEHAVLPAVPRPESSSYHPSDFEHDGKYASLGYLQDAGPVGPQPYRAHWMTHLAQVEHHDEPLHHVLPAPAPEHYRIDVETTPLDTHQRRYEVVEDHSSDWHHDPMHFVIEEPTPEAHTVTFHGREPGYVYRDHPADHPAHAAAHPADPWAGLRHGETFGPLHGAEDVIETLAGAHHDFDLHGTTERLVEPVFVHGHSYAALHDAGPHHEVLAVHHETHAHPAAERRYEIPGHHDREVEYVLDGAGHVHTFEEMPPSYHSFLQ